VLLAWAGSEEASTETTQQPPARAAPPSSGRARNHYHVSSCEHPAESRNRRFHHHGALYRTVEYRQKRDDTPTPADAAIALYIATSGDWDANADVSGDNRVTPLDALMILQVAAGAISL